MTSDELHFLLRKAHTVTTHQLIAQTGKLGLTPGQPKVLEYLLEHDGCCARAICQEFAIDKSTMASILPRMEAAGLVRRESSETDRRTSCIWLTDKGRELALATKKAILATDEELVQGVSPEDLATCKQVLASIVANAETVSASSHVGK